MERDSRWRGYVHPDNLLCADVDGGAAPVWTCARTRPHWEKRFARWLAGQDMPFFLPVLRKVSVSHRKRCVRHLPLFPGYVFVLGKHGKDRFQRSDCVAYVLHPRSAVEAANLDAVLRHLWRVLTAEQPLAPVFRLTPGQRVRVRSGPLMGVEGVFVQVGRKGQLVLWMDMIGAGVSVEVADPRDVEPVV